MMEAATHGKPLIVVPLFGDQTRNAKLVEKYGFGILLEKSRLLQSTVLHDAIDKVLSDQKYQNAAVRIRRLLSRRPISPKEKLVKTIELVAEFGNLPEQREFSKVCEGKISVGAAFKRRNINCSLGQGFLVETLVVVTTGLVDADVVVAADDAAVVAPDVIEAAPDADEDGADADVVPEVADTVVADADVVPDDADTVAVVGDVCADDVVVSAGVVGDVVVTDVSVDVLLACTSIASKNASSI
ncbi:hypothetical protein Y032_0123g1151 [Ancylostoma ceylanicum]|uniref:glucuronosyltransferase n=1 Tax=Ancylostoma ceylanicum TaxID=53326 RepID=A0A016T9P2_9BILA|nr:hypothetical protein Y032_0123g1151 [Ancylostoma ceylanicum]